MLDLVQETINREVSTYNDFKRRFEELVRPNRYAFKQLSYLKGRAECIKEFSKNLGRDPDDIKFKCQQCEETKPAKEMFNLGKYTCIYCEIINNEMD